ncbi:MFS transporter [Siminovitchia sediminis]|uniref:MFS transporter n=1 Tax=Siminovitchia sediminis TaxID=1274353 RepID=A0ABW4KFE3_9BACI
MVLVVATVAQTTAAFVTFGMGPMAALYQTSYNLSQFETGLIVSAVNIGPIFSLIIFGNLMDKYGEKWVVGIGSILLGFHILVSYFIHSYIVLLINLLFAGIWYGTAQPGGSSAIVKWFPDRNRGLAMGIRQTGIPLGGALAAALLPFIFFQYGLPPAVLVQGGIAVIGGLVFLILYKNKTKEYKRRQELPFKEKIIRIKNNTQLYPVFFIGVAMVSVQLITIAHLMGYLTNVIHVGLSQAGVFMSLALFGGILGRILLAWVSDTIFHGDRGKPLQITAWSAALCILGFILSHAHLPVWIIGTLCLIHGFFGFGWYSLFIVLVAERSDTRFIALTVSFALTLNQIFIVASPALFGLLVDQLNGYTIPFALLAAAVCAGGIWLKVSETKNTAGD